MTKLFTGDIVDLIRNSIAYGGADGGVRMFLF